MGFCGISAAQPVSTVLAVMDAVNKLGNLEEQQGGRTELIDE